VQPAPMMRPIAPLLIALAALLAGAQPARGQTQRDVKNDYKALGKEVSAIARGLETALGKDDVAVAARLYRLEMKSIGLLARNAETDYTDLEEKASWSSSIRSLHDDVLLLQERVLEHTLIQLDRALPGEPLRELWAREGIDLYRPLYRTGTPDPARPRPSREEGRQVLARMQQDFFDEGGADDEIIWFGPRYLENVGNGELVEWVQLGERIRVTAAGAKHPVIADGSSVRGAGSMKIYKDSKGEVILAVVSNSSGNYKPGVGSTIGLSDKLEELGVRRDRIVQTTILPGEPVLVKLLLKARKTFSKEEIGQRIGLLKMEGDLELPPARPKGTGERRFVKGGKVGGAKNKRAFRAEKKALRRIGRKPPPKIRRVTPMGRGGVVHYSGRVR
jgi:hypothetical protein